MSVWRDGLPHPTVIFEAAVWHYLVKVSCSRCPHFTLFEPPGLWWRFHKKDWNQNFSDAWARFWCSQCAIQGDLKVRPRRLEAVKWNDRLPTTKLPDPDIWAWKRATRQFR